MRFDGIRSVVYFCDDIAGAAQWYEHILGIEPYRLDEHFAGFHLADCDLCLHRRDEKSSEGSQVLYWIVEDLDEVTTSLLAEGCSLYRAAQEVPEGGRVTQVKDPYGNILGLSELA